MIRHRDNACVTTSSRGSIITAAVLGAAIFALAPAAAADQPQKGQSDPYSSGQPQPGMTQQMQSTQQSTTTTTTTGQPAPTGQQAPIGQPAPPSQPPTSSDVNVEHPTDMTTQYPATSTTQTTSAEYTETVAAEHVHEVRPNRPMLVSGLTLLVAPYVAGVIVASTNDLHADNKLYIPVVGPWLDLSERPCSFGSDCSTSDNIGSALLIGSGVAQGLGVILTAASFVTPERHMTTSPVAAQKPHVSFSPVSYRRGGGVSAVGTF
jgi:hypothetical protein